MDILPIIDNLSPIFFLVTLAIIFLALIELYKIADITGTSGGNLANFVKYFLLTLVLLLASFMVIFVVIITESRGFGIGILILIVASLMLFISIKELRKMLNVLLYIE